MNRKKEISRIFLWIKYLKLTCIDNNRKSILRIIYEFLALTINKRCLATHYFTSLLYKAPILNYRDYLTVSEMSQLQENLCDQITVDISHNKLFFQEYFEKRHISMPRLLAYNFGMNFFIKNKEDWMLEEIKSLQNIRDLVANMLSNSKSGSVFIKPISGSSGSGARKIEKNRKEWGMESYKEFQKYLETGSFLFQEEVIQHADLARINSTSLNTMRIDIFKDFVENVDIISAFLRMGLAGSHVDNIAAGGIFVGINMADGTLKEQGFNKLGKGGFTYLAHPDTNVVFKKYRIPFFFEAISLAINAARLLPAALIGWDIAVSENGPVLMEGNAVYYDMQLSDIAFGGYRKNPIIQKLIKYIE